jgi:hypothetical protein
MYWIVALAVTLLGVAIHLIARAEPSPVKTWWVSPRISLGRSADPSTPLLCAASNVVSCRARRRSEDR